MCSTWILITTFNDRNPGTIIKTFIVQAADEESAIEAAKTKANAVFGRITNFSVSEINRFSKAEDDLIVSISDSLVKERIEWTIVKIVFKLIN